MTPIFALCFFITCAVFIWFAVTTLRGRKTAPPEEVYIPYRPGDIAREVIEMIDKMTPEEIQNEDLRAVFKPQPQPDFMAALQPEPRKLFTLDRFIFVVVSIGSLALFGIPGLVVFIVLWWAANRLPWHPAVTGAGAAILLLVLQFLSMPLTVPPKAAPAAVIDLPIEPWLAKEEARPCLRPSCDMRTGSD